jgi:chloride channel 3/4/5
VSSFQCISRERGNGDDNNSEIDSVAGGQRLNSTDLDVIPSTNGNGSRANMFDSPDESRILFRRPNFQASDPQISSCRKAEDFTTIDWARDLIREATRQSGLNRRRRHTPRGALYKTFDAVQGWLVVFLIGLLAGFSAGVCDISATWLIDIRVGSCPGPWWLNFNHCCWAEPASSEVSCSSWRTWASWSTDNITSKTAYAIDYFTYAMFSVLFATGACVLCKTLAPYARGSGIPELKTILSGFVIHGYFGFWTYIVKCVAMVLATASGLSLGKEGPTIHIACCCGNIIARFFPKYRNNEAKKREMLSAAAAAGISIAFGAPVGGVLFSLEEVSYYFPHKTMWRAFFCALVAAATLGSMNPFVSERQMALYITYDTPWHWFELLPFCFIGVCGGLFGALFCKFNIMMSKLRKTSWLGRAPVLEVTVLSLVTAICAYPNPYTRGDTLALIRAMFSDCSEPISDLVEEMCSTGNGQLIGLLILATVFRVIFTILTTGAYVPAGLFIPSMAVGAAFGRLVGIGVEAFALNNPDLQLIARSCPSLQTCVQPGLYAMVGATAALGGLMRMTVALVVIMFEVTGGLTYILPFMTAALVSKWIGDWLHHEGIYEAHINLNGYPFLDNKTEFFNNDLLSDVWEKICTGRELKVITLHGNTLGSIERLLDQCEYSGFPLVNTLDEMLVEGYVSRRELESRLLLACSRLYEVLPDTPCHFISSSSRSGIDLHDTVNRSAFQLAADMPIVTVVEVFRRMGIRYALITVTGRLTGLITKKDVLKYIAVQHNLDPEDVRFH